MGRGWGTSALTVLVMSLLASGPCAAPPDNSVEAAYQFLSAMMNRHGGAQAPQLPQSYTGGRLELDGYTSSTTYDDALMMDALLARGTPEDVRLARLIADGLLVAQRRDPTGDGRLRAAYESGVVPEQGPVHPTNATSDTGAMAWAGRALLHLYERTAEPSYLDAARRLAEWIQAHAYDDRGSGGYTGGLDAGDQPLRWKSTEHNLDLVSFFTALATATGDSGWTDRARQAHDFVLSQYDEARHRFATGTELDGVTVNRAFIPADVQTWSYLVLRDPRYAASLDEAESTFVAQDGPFKGISATADQRDAVWFEGTAHLALALRLRANPDDAAKAQRYLDTIALAQRTAVNADGRGIVAASRDTAPNAQGVRLYSSLHTGTTAWYIMAAQSWNPF